MDRTHDPSRRSWVSTADVPDTDFPLQNLPFGSFRPRGSKEGFRVGVAIGDQILDLRRTVNLAEGTSDLAVAALQAGNLNELMALGADARRRIRDWLFEGLAEGSSRARTWHEFLVPSVSSELALPCTIGD